MNNHEFIPFNKPSIVGQELTYIADAVSRGHLSGNGYYSKKCQYWFEQTFSFGKCLLTTSCTDALEMCALLLNIKPGDEVIMPSYTFVSTANAFALRGAKIVFVDSENEHPNIPVSKIEKAITSNTKAVIVVHYAGFPCEMESISSLTKKHKILLIEDAAQAINVKYHDRYLGAWGDLATFSFHETKNVQCGEGGMLVVNNSNLQERAEIIWEKGTNRQAFFKGQVDKYRWVDLGSSFLLSDLNASYLWGQLEVSESITEKRKNICERYSKGLQSLKDKEVFTYPEKQSPNGHIFFLLFKDLEKREALRLYLKEKNILSVFHYQCLHKSPFYLKSNKDCTLENAERFEDSLLRLPVYNELTKKQVDHIIQAIVSFYKDTNS